MNYSISLFLSRVYVSDYPCFFSFIRAMPSPPLCGGEGIGFVMHKGIPIAIVRLRHKKL